MLEKHQESKQKYSQAKSSSPTKEEKKTGKPKNEKIPKKLERIKYGRSKISKKF